MSFNLLEHCDFATLRHLLSRFSGKPLGWLDLHAVNKQTALEQRNNYPAKMFSIEVGFSFDLKEFTERLMSALLVRCSKLQGLYKR